MLDHLHLIVWWDVDENKVLTISKIIQSIKSHSAKEILNYLNTGRRKPSLSPYSQAASEGSPLPSGYKWVDKGLVHTPAIDKIWQKSFYDFNIYSEEKLREKLNYIHWNLPLRGITRRVTVRAGLCKKPEDWPWSSCSFYKYGRQREIKIDII